MKRRLKVEGRKWLRRRRSSAATSSLIAFKSSVVHPCSRRKRDPVETHWPLRRRARRLNVLAGVVIQLFVPIGRTTLGGKSKMFQSGSRVPLWRGSWSGRWRRTAFPLFPAADSSRRLRHSRSLAKAITRSRGALAITTKLRPAASTCSAAPGDGDRFHSAAKLDLFGQQIIAGSSIFG